MFRNMLRLAVGLSFVFFLLLPAQAQAQVEAAGSWKFTLAGSGTFGTGGSLSNTIGASRFTEGGWEYGANLHATIVSTVGDTLTFGALTGRVTYNFIGESLTVPFVDAGFGTSLGLGGGVAYDFGGGVKRFFSDNASLDVRLSYEGSLAMFYGVSLYLKDD